MLRSLKEQKGTEHSEQKRMLCPTLDLPHYCHVYIVTYSCANLLLTYVSRDLPY